MKDLIVVSDYDSCYRFNVMLDGIVLEDDSEDYQWIYEHYTSFAQYIWYILDKYKKNVLLIIDGCLEYFTYKEEV